MQESRLLFYREQQGGLLVYDSHSRTPDDPEFESRPPRVALSPEKLSILASSELHDRLQYLGMASYPQSKFIDKEYTLVFPSENTLRFNSSFESGNLSKAIKISEDEYDLHLEFDTETQGYTQWFYFSVKCFKPAHTVRFNVMNLTKPQSLYSKGLKPLIFSSKTSQNWERGGFDITYLQNSLIKKVIIPGQPVNYFTLSFSYTFLYADERVFFAQSYPYTYNQLNKYLKTLASNQNYKSFLNVSTLCKTLAGNDCFLLTITDGVTQNDESFKAREKKVVFFSARVHPGETNSSYTVKGIIDYLLTDTPEAKSLRKKFIFKIVPMLNPDGVIYGNYRCSLLGVDLNRRWKNPNSILHPTIFHTKQLIDGLSKTHGIFLFCDIHGHSRKVGSFIYGCRKKPLGMIEHKENIMIRLFPLIMASRYQNFDYSSCKFRIEKFKESTARVVVFKEFGVLWSFTLENSFLGLNQDYDQLQLQEIGYSLCNALWFFRSWGQIKKGTEQIYRILCSSDKSSSNISESTESIAPSIIDEVYNEKDFEGNDTESDSEKKKIWLQKQDLRIIIRRRTGKNVQSVKIQTKSSGLGTNSISRSTSANKMIRPQVMTFKDKSGSFKRVKLMQRTLSTNMGCGNNKGQSLSVVVNKQQMMKKVSLNAQSEDDNAHIIEAGKKFKSYKEDVFDQEINKRLESKNNISESLAKINEDDAKPKEIEIGKVNLQLNLIEPVKQKLSLGVYEHKFDFDLDPSARKEGESSRMISQVIHELNEI